MYYKLINAHQSMQSSLLAGGGGGGGQVQLTDWTGAVAGLAPLESPVHTDIQTRLEALLSLIDNYEYVLVIKVIVNDA